VIVIGRTDARVSTNQRDTRSIRPGGGLLVRSTYRQLRRSDERGATWGEGTRSPTSVMTFPFVAVASSGFALTVGKAAVTAQAIGRLVLRPELLWQTPARQVRAGTKECS
jgi:hypothetical protein